MDGPHNHKAAHKSQITLLNLIQHTDMSLNPTESTYQHCGYKIVQIVGHVYNTRYEIFEYSHL